MRTKQQVQAIISRLEEEYPLAECSLQYEKDYELLFATRLSAQCTDERVNKVTPALFERFPSLQSLAEAEVEEVEQYIHSCGFYRGKAKDIVACSKVLLEEYDGKVPGTMEELVKLPGVGRKTANLILGDIFHVPGSTVVDTHCIRLTNRIGLIDNMKEPEKIERKKSNDFCHRMVLHGRAVCKAQKPQCDHCCIRDLCVTGSGTD